MVSAKSARNTAKIRRVLAILDSHADQHHALKELATLAGLSRFYFSRTFHASVGVSLREYLRGLKLKRALELVRTTRRSLTDIAVEAGFYDLPHLDKAFRQRFGRSPYQFRGPRRPTARRPVSTSRRGL